MREGDAVAISERKKKILAAVIDEYIRTAEPVGSKLISEMAGLDVSSATIRNELSELVAAGFLEQPHTSAGRVPTPQGYRLYVNELMAHHKLSLEETEEINQNLQLKVQKLDKLMDDVGRLAADMTNYPALSLSAKTPCSVKRFDLIYIDANTFILVVMLSDNTVKNKLFSLPFSVEEAMVRRLSTVINSSFTGITEEQITPLLISSAERALDDGIGLLRAVSAFTIEILSESKAAQASFSGEAKLFQLPEFRDAGKASRIMDFFSDSKKLTSLQMPDFGDDVQVLIGPENIAEELRDSSVILAKYSAGDGMQGIIGVVGPTRMDYSKIAAKLSYLADGISKALASSPDTALPGLGKLMIKDENK